jgi:hypothetical protein
VIYYLIHLALNLLALTAVGYILIAFVFGPWIIVNETYQRIKDKRRKDK